MPGFSQEWDTFRDMPAGNDGLALMRAMDRLCAELRGPRGAGEDDGSTPLSDRRWDLSPVLGADDEALVATIMAGLEGVAIAAGAGSAEGPARRAVIAALAGTELAIRGELVMGRADRLPALMPSFVFLVTLPVVDQDRALELWRRVAQLVDESS
jgi:hypothetical protein